MLVIIESPYKGDIEKNKAYAIKCLQDSFKRGEFPFASHILYTECLNDNIPEEREKGIDAGLEWGKHAKKTVVYFDLGISKGMQYGIDNANKMGRPIEYRSIL